MNNIAKEISILEKKIKFIQDNYTLIASIISDIKDQNIPVINLLDNYKQSLLQINNERTKDTRQIDIEDAINREKSNTTSQGEWV